MNRRTALALTAAPVLCGASGPRIFTVRFAPGTEYAFPPRGKAYRENGASHRLWRQILIEAPDAVIVPAGNDFGLSQALSGKVYTGTTRPAKVEKSALHSDQEQRLARTPRGLLTQLSGQYGQELKDMVYTLSFSVWGRLLAGQVDAVRSIFEPFLDGRIDSLAKPTASHYSGHLPLAAYFEKSGDTRARDRVLAAAKAARENPLHNEMSDSFFMVTPLLAKAGEYTKDSSWFDAAYKHFALMQKLCLRGDGLYRHSPLDEAPWGRGNGFSILGMALALSSLPADNPIRKPYEQAAAKLVAMQTPSGTWRQVVDKPEAWEEFTCTAIIGWALQRGLRRKWIRGKQYQAAVDRAWRAVQVRTSLAGELIDVCESTGKQKSLQDYFDREAILGKDPRGGAMAMMFAAELARA